MEYKNILVINLMHIGDLMLATPVLRTLRANYPDARISLLADKKLRDLVEHNKHIDECLLIDKKGKDDHFGSLWQFIAGLRKKKFDLVINLHRNERASAIAAFSGAKRIVGYSKPGFSLLFDEVMQNPSVAHHIGRGPFQLLPPYRYVPGWKCGCRKQRKKKRMLYGLSILPPRTRSLPSISAPAGGRNAGRIVISRNALMNLSTVAIKSLSSAVRWIAGLSKRVSRRWKIGIAEHFIFLPVK